ncbi:MAG TPA: DUF2306 domain-containing protein [Chitinophagaceae bacterium]|nr:DUF2306 domain-containing protein [Chitinophagaceae bacterium]
MRPNILKKNLLIAGWILLLLVSVYYILHNCLPFFVFTEASYSRHFWPRASWLFIHIVSGIVATLVIPFQLIPSIRKNYLSMHRSLGYTYLISVTCSSVTSFYLAATSDFNIAYITGFTCFTFAWISTTLMGYIAIINRNITQHREWMIRSYVVTLGFSTMRLLKDSLVPVDIATRPHLITALTWISWVIPLFITELVLRARKVKGTNTLPANNK